MNKRTILITAITIISTILVGPLGFSPAISVVGLVLCVIIGKKGDRVAVDLFQRGRVTVTEITRKAERVPPPEPVRHDTPTVPIEGHFRPVTAHESERAFTIGTTEDGRVIELDEISSLGVGGVTGSGKTVSVVGLCTQAVVKYQGAVRFLVVDPHMHTGSPDALSARMSPLAPFYLDIGVLPNPVSGGGDLVTWLEYLTKEARDRIDGKVPWDGRQKIVLVVDEFTAIMDDPALSPLLSRLLLLINEQARKVDMFALVSSPQWKASRVSGTEVRNTIASFLVHNMPPNIARQLVPCAEAETANRLTKGQAIFSSFGVVEVVRVPLRQAARILEDIEPFLPEPAPTPVFGEVVSAEEPEEDLPEPPITDIRAIWETYQILDRDLKYAEENIIRALAIDFYPEDPRGKEKVMRALKLGEENL